MRAAQMARQVYGEGNADAPEQGDQRQAYMGAEQRIDRDGSAAEEDQEEGPRKFTEKISFEHDNSLLFEFGNGRNKTMIRRPHPAGQPFVVR